MNLKNKLLQSANKTLAVKHKEALLVPSDSQIKKITQEILADLSEMKEIQDFVLQKRHRYAHLREQILKSLLYVRDHKKELGISSFQNYLQEEIGLTKGYFYEQVQAYELCVEYHKEDYFTKVDYKILVAIARIKDKEKQKRLLLEAPSLTRETLLLERRPSLSKTGDPYSLEIESLGEREWRLSLPKTLSSSQRKEFTQFLLEKSREFWEEHR